jgi:hypothetical protein
MVVISIALMDWNDMSHRIRTLCVRGRRRPQDASRPAGRAGRYLMAGIIAER